MIEILYYVFEVFNDVSDEVLVEVIDRWLAYRIGGSNTTDYGCISNTIDLLFCYNQLMERIRFF